MSPTPPPGLPPGLARGVGRLTAALAPLRRLSRHHWLYLPRLFSRQEQIRLLAILTIAVLAGAALAARLYLRVSVQRPAAGGVLREGVTSEPRFINPLYAASDTDRDLTSLVFAKLIRYDTAGVPAMDLAESVEQGPDAKTYLIRLRTGVRWHDGEPLTADDVLLTIRAIQDPEYQSSLRPNWQGVAAEKVDDRTIRLTLRQPYSPFMENLAIGILPAHLWRKIPREAASRSDLNLKPIGAGPYRFQKLTRRGDGRITAVVLTRNRHYHLPGPYISEIRFSIWASEADLVAAYRRNEIDSFLFLTRRPLDELARLDVNLHALRLPKIFAVFLNANRKAPLGRIKVRQALSAAIDREALVARTVASGGEVSGSPLPPGTFGFSGAVTPPPHDPERARGLLEADGWRAGSEGVVERSQGRGRGRTTERLEFELATSDAPELADAAALIADMWRAIGARVNVKTLAVEDLEREVIRPRAYDALLFGEVLGHDPDPFAFWHTSQLKDPGLNIALYANRRVDELLEEARRISDPALRREKYGEFQKIVADEVGAVFLYRPTHTYAIRRTTRGVALGAVALPEERFSAIHEWYQDTRRVLTW